MHCLRALYQGLPGQGYGGSPIATGYGPRSYRHWVNDKDLVSFTVAVKETDLFIRARHDLAGIALESTRRHRAALEGYIEAHPAFAISLVPLPVAEDAPAIVKEMAGAGREAGVGPMAAVAGAIAQAVGRELLSFSDEVIVENGGDIFLRTSQSRSVGIYAGSSVFTGRIALDIQPEDTPLGVCASSGTVGHSLSFGQADAVVVLCPSTPLADAAATAIANRVQAPTDIPAALEFAQTLKGLKGVVIIKDDHIGLWGQVKIAPPPPPG